MSRCVLVFGVYPCCSSVCQIITRRKGLKKEKDTNLIHCQFIIHRTVILFRMEFPIPILSTFSCCPA